MTSSLPLPSRVNHEMPEVLSKIILKLMEKNAEHPLAPHGVQL